MRNGKACEENKYILRVNDCPVLGFAGWSGSGKTTLIEKLIPLLKQKGFGIAVIKHDVHGLKKRNPVGEDGGYDIPGTDSWRFRNAGADAVILCGPEGPDLKEALEKAAREETPAGMARGLQTKPRLILVEGFKNAAIWQIGISRKENGKGLTSSHERFIAIVTDDPPAAVCTCPVFGFEEQEKLADYIAAWAVSAEAAGII